MSWKGGLFPLPKYGGGWLDDKCALGWWDEGIGETCVNCKSNLERIKQVSLLELLRMRKRKCLVLSHHFAETFFISGKIRWLKGMWKGKQERKNCGTHQELLCPWWDSVTERKKMVSDSNFQSSKGLKKAGKREGPALEGQSEHWGDCSESFISLTSLSSFSVQWMYISSRWF